MRVRRAYWASNRPASTFHTDIRVQCKKIVTIDNRSPVLVCPQVVVHVWNTRLRIWVEVSRTEVVMEEPDAQFITSIGLKYDDSVQQDVLFTVHDVGTGEDGPTEKNAVGEFMTTLRDLVAETNMMTSVDLRPPRYGPPTVCVVADQPDSDDDEREKRRIAREVAGVIGWRVPEGVEDPEDDTEERDDAGGRRSSTVLDDMTPESRTTTAMTSSESPNQNWFRRDMGTLNIYVSTFSFPIDDNRAVSLEFQIEVPLSGWSLDAPGLKDTELANRGKTRKFRQKDVVLQISRLHQSGVYLPVVRTSATEVPVPSRSPTCNPLYTFKSIKIPLLDLCALKWDASIRIDLFEAMERGAATVTSVPRRTELAGESLRMYTASHFAATVQSRATANADVASPPDLSNRRSRARATVTRNVGYVVTNLEELKSYAVVRHKPDGEDVSHRTPLLIRREEDNEPSGRRKTRRRHYRRQLSDFMFAHDPPPPMECPRFLQHSASHERGNKLRRCAHSPSHSHTHSHSPPHWTSPTKDRLSPSVMERSAGRFRTTHAVSSVSEQAMAVMSTSGLIQSHTLATGGVSDSDSGEDTRAPPAADPARVALEVARLFGLQHPPIRGAEHASVQEEGGRAGSIVGMLRVGQCALKEFVPVRTVKDPLSNSALANGFASSAHLVSGHAAANAAARQMAGVTAVNAGGRARRRKWNATELVPPFARGLIVAKDRLQNMIAVMQRKNYKTAEDATLLLSLREELTSVEDSLNFWTAAVEENPALLVKQDDPSSTLGIGGFLSATAAAAALAAGSRPKGGCQLGAPSCKSTIGAGDAGLVEGLEGDPPSPSALAVSVARRPRKSRAQLQRENVKSRFRERPPCDEEKQERCRQQRQWLRGVSSARGLSKRKVTRPSGVDSDASISDGDISPSRTPPIRQESLDLLSSLPQIKESVTEKGPSPRSQSSEGESYYSSSNCSDDNDSERGNPSDTQKGLSFQTSEERNETADASPRSVRVGAAEKEVTGSDSGSGREGECSQGYAHSSGHEMNASMATQEAQATSRSAEKSGGDGFASGSTSDDSVNVDDRADVKPVHGANEGFLSAAEAVACDGMAPPSDGSPAAYGLSASPSSLSHAAGMESPAPRTAFSLMSSSSHSPLPKPRMRHDTSGSMTASEGKGEALPDLGALPSSKRVLFQTIKSPGSPHRVPVPKKRVMPQLRGAVVLQTSPKPSDNRRAVAGLHKRSSVMGGMLARTSLKEALLPTKAKTFSRGQRYSVETGQGPGTNAGNVDSSSDEEREQLKAGALAQVEAMMHSPQVKELAARIRTGPIDKHPPVVRKHSDFDDTTLKMSLAKQLDSLGVAEKGIYGKGKLKRRIEAEITSLLDHLQSL
eukprot:Rmarinus@m.16714